MSKYYPRLKIYKNSTGTFTYNPETGEAHSYTWWKFAMVYKGVRIFNGYRYSPSTGRHQYDYISIVDFDRGLYVHIPQGLQVDNWLELAIKQKRGPNQYLLGRDRET